MYKESLVSFFLNKDIHIVIYMCFRSSRWDLVGRNDCILQSLPRLQDSLPYIKKSDILGIFHNAIDKVVEFLYVFFCIYFI